VTGTAGDIHGAAATALLVALIVHLGTALAYPLRGLTAIALRMRYPVKDGR